jgi:hypothetical protein
VVRGFIVLLALLFVPGVAASDTTAVYYRLFLTDGTSLASYGEFARVADRVVFSMRLGGSDSDPRLQLVSISAAQVDWTATEQYADAARAAHYAATRGEEEYAAINDAVAAALNGVAQTTDPPTKLRIADAARRRLAEWSRSNYGYRSRDVAQLSSMLDEVIAEIQANGVATNGAGFELQLVATLTPPPAVPLLGTPSDREQAQQGLAVAGLAADASERRTLLDSVVQSLSGRTESWATTLASRARQDLEAETGLDRLYAVLTQTAIKQASAQAAAANVRGVQGVIADVLSRDDQLGRRRPAEVSALLATLDVRLDAARKLRLVRDRWLLRIPEYRAYSRNVAEGVQLLSGLRHAVDDIRELAGPSRAVLLRAQLDASEAALAFSRVTPPEDLAPVHALFVSAVQLASSACKQRLAAVSSGSEQDAWSASSAAAGSLMLLDRARQDLTRWLKPPSLP